ncbi:hypothetical protein [Streptomyces aquilus]|uniref:hypothetical protein n=1 Tax=Streptomyces aquilus TaxID=2548456 RepID=UPI001417096E|nr:hypothetical protein [Streptomyces aquilus]
MTTPITEDTRPTDDLKMALVESLMAVIGAPDDDEAAEKAATIIHTLDERLTAEATSA